MTDIPSAPLAARSANAALLRDLIRAQVSLQRVQARLFKRDVLPALLRAEREINAHVAALELGTRTLNDVSRARLNALMAQVQAVLANAGGQASSGLTATLADVANRERRLLVATAKKALPAIVPGTFSQLPVAAIAQAGKLAGEEMVGPWFASWSGDALAAVKTQVEVGVTMGKDNAEIARAIKKAMGDSIGNATTIARTATARVAAAAKMTWIDSNQDLWKGVQWIATLDSRTCPTCGPLDGLVWTYETMAGSAGLVETMPDVPRHPNCFPAGVIVSGPRPELGFRRWYEGDLVVIRRSSGDPLPVTPNHPILTRRGFIPAGELLKGDELIDGAVGHRVLSESVRPDEQDVPAEIEEKTRSLGVRRFRVPVTGPDFHGDGTDGEVYVQVSDRFLAGEVDPSVSEHGFEVDFIRGVLDPSTGFGSRPFGSSVETTLRPTDRVVRRRCPLASHGGAGLLHADQHGFASRPWPDTHSDQAWADGGTGDAEVLGASLLRDLPLDVHGSEVTQVDRTTYRGHVHTLQSPTGWFVANGVIVQNCRCTQVPVAWSLEELEARAKGAKLVKPEPPPEARASQDGEVAGSMTWDQWFRDQPRGIQKSVLGPGKFAAWKNGGLLEGFSDVARRVTAAALPRRMWLRAQSARS